MKVAEMLKKALDDKGLKNLKDASRELEISPELLRVILNKGHIPKDTTLKIIAKKLNIDTTLLVLAAHQEKVPDEVKGFFLTPSQNKLGRGKRKYPLSEEQTDYLAKILSNAELKLIRDFRLVTEEARVQILGYVDFVYATKKTDKGTM